MHVIDADIQRFARTMGEAVTAVCVFGKGGGGGGARGKPGELWHGHAITMTKRRSPALLK
jgi:hypothetical protein